MKKIMNFVAALAVVLPVSCNKEMTTPQGDTLVGKNVKVTMNAIEVDPLSKVTLNGKRFEWEVGDELQTTYYTGTPLTAISAGSGATFEGEASGFPASKGNMYVFYTIGGTVDGAYCTKEVPSIQSGLSSDIKNYGIWSSWITQGNQHYYNSEGDEISSGIPFSVEIDAEMVPNFSVLKFTVPQELGLTSIAITADANIAGTVKVNAARTPTSTSGGTPNGKNRFTCSSPYETIEISRNGDVISGDVYVVIAPDSYNADQMPADWNRYYNSATKLSFEFSDGTSNINFESVLSSQIVMGELTNLGTLPLNIMTPKVDAGTLALLNTTDLTVAVNKYNSDCTYYYEIGTSPENCKTPTVQSAIFNPETGFSPTISSDFDRYFIKVLAHYDGTEYRDVILRASLRNWKFHQDTETASILEQVNDSTLLVEKATGVYTGDGLFVYRTKFAYNNNTDKLPLASISYEASTKRIGFTSSNVSLYVTSEYSSNVWLQFNVDKSTAVKSGTTRTYNLYVNKATVRTNSYTDNTGVSYITLNNEYKSDGTSKKVSVCWNLGNNDEGDMFAFAGDGKHILYSMSYLEVL